MYQFDTVVHDSSHCKTFDGNLVPKVIVIDGVLCFNYEKFGCFKMQCWSTLNYKKLSQKLNSENTEKLPFVMLKVKTVNFDLNMYVSILECLSITIVNINNLNYFKFYGINYEVICKFNRVCKKPSLFHWHCR